MDSINPENGPATFRIFKK